MDNVAKPTFCSHLLYLSFLLRVPATINVITSWLFNIIFKLTAHTSKTYVITLEKVCNSLCLVSQPMVTFWTYWLCFHTAQEGAINSLNSYKLHESNILGEKIYLNRVPAEWERTSWGHIFYHTLQNALKCHSHKKSFSWHWNLLRRQLRV